MCGDVSLSLDLLKKRRYNKQTIKKFYPKERGPELKSRNQSMDMTQGVIWKQLAYFALPLFLGNLCQQLYNTADSVIVGKFVGKDALAAVSSSGNLIFMMTGFFMGLFVGAGVIISRYFGAKCYDRLEAAVHTDLAFAMVCGVLLTAIGVYEPIVQWGGAGATVPLLGFGYSLAKGVEKAVQEQGWLGVMTGGLSATAGGIAAAVVFAVLMALIFKPGDKR